MRPIAEATARVTGQSCSRKYIALGRVMTSWPEIVGAALAAKAQPIKIRYGKPDKSKAPAAILEIAASSSDATLLHYQKDLILQRINQIFGAGWITGIRFVPAAANPAPRKPPKRKNPLTENQKTYLSDILEGIDDASMKDSLAALGEAVLMETT